MYDVLEVNMATHRVRLLATNKDHANAEATINMAVARRGVDESFYVTAPHGSYQDGDEWRAHEC